MVSLQQRLANPRTVEMSALMKAAHIDFTWKAAPETVLSDLELDVTTLMNIIKIPDGNAADLVKEASQSGWAKYNP